MSRKSILIISGLLLILTSASCVWSVTLFSEDWEAAELGPLPDPWRAATSSNPTTEITIVQGYASNTTKTLKFRDTNADTTNNTVFTTFPQRSYGIVSYQFDCCFPNRQAGWGMRITNGLTPTSGANWCAAIKFEGNNPSAPGAVFGDVSYQEYTSGTNAYVRTNPVVQYNYNMWYTVKIQANLIARRYEIFMGPKGSALSRITPTGGVQFIRTATGSQVSFVGGISVFSSQFLDGSGSVYIDNVTVTSDLEEPCTIAEAKSLPKNTLVALVDKVVSGGTDQMRTPSFFYIQDETGGIRVRSSTVVRQGDRVTIYGTTQRASDNGTAVLRNGEREINASSVSVTYGPNTILAPVAMSNRSIGGGPSTAIDSDGYPCQPGVWAASNGAPSGYDQIDETGPNNVGNYGLFTGTVVYADNTNRFFYINDGSNVQDGGALADGSPSPLGVRVLAPPGVPLTGIVGKSATITGIVGSVAQSDAGSPSGPGGNYIRNIRVIRPTCEMFTDLNMNGFWDSGEPYIDINANGNCDGIRISGVTGPTFISAFDRYGTLILRGQPFLVKSCYIYDINGPDLTEMVNQGFNTIVNFDTLVPGHLSTLNAYGLKVLPCLRTPATRPDWMAVKNDNAIIGWYTHDEPEGTGVSPSQALTDYQWVKAQDPQHVAGNSHYILSAFADYKDSEEYTISDVYPVTSSGAPLTPMADIMWTIHNVHGSVYYPGWQHIQIFDAAPQILPTPAQVRAMMYLVLAYNAKGILYFSYQRPPNPMWPSVWAEVKTLNGELDKFRSFLTLPWTPVEATTSNESIRIGGFRVGNSALIITVNITGSVATSTLTLPGIPVANLTLPLEGNALQPLTDRSFTYTYQPYQVRVLLWGEIPPTSGSVSYSTPINFIKSNAWNCVSLPADPLIPDPLVVFSGIDVSNSSFQYWRNDVDGGGYQNFGELFGWTGPVARGIPYWFYELTPNRIVRFSAYPPTSDFEITIPAHNYAPYWIMFGTPFPNAVSADNIRFKNIAKRGDTWLTWQQAYSNDNASLRIVESNAQGWNALTSSYFGVAPTGWLGVHQFDPWYGYWILVHDRGEMKIKFPKP